MAVAAPGGHDKVQGRGDTMTSRDLPNQPLSGRTPAAATASAEILVPPHNGNQTLDGIILCLPAQGKNSDTINLQTIATTIPPKNLTSPSQHLDSNTNRDAMTSRDLQNQPFFQRTLAAAAASPENLVPPHNQNQTLGGIILCLPAQRKNSRTAPASSGRDAQDKKVDESLHQNTITPFTASSSGVEGKQAMKRRFGAKSPLANPFSIGNTGVHSQSNLPRKPKELPHNGIRRMLMDKARTEILGYLNN